MWEEVFFIFGMDEGLLSPLGAAKLNKLPAKVFLVGVSLGFYS
jgi:hypothetical protein